MCQPLGHSNKIRDSRTLREGVAIVTKFGIRILDSSSFYFSYICWKFLNFRMITINYAKAIVHETHRQKFNSKICLYMYK